MTVYHNSILPTATPTLVAQDYLLWTSVNDDVGVSLCLVLRLYSRRSVWNQGHQKALGMWTLRSYPQLLRDQCCQSKVQNTQQHLHSTHVVYGPLQHWVVLK